MSFLLQPCDLEKGKSLFADMGAVVFLGLIYPSLSQAMAFGSVPFQSCDSQLFHFFYICMPFFRRVFHVEEVTKTL